MFGKKCSKCNRNISKNYDFCPFCGNSFKSRDYNEDYGFLGKNDIIENENPFANFNDSFMDKIFSATMKQLPSMIKMIEKQLEESSKEISRTDEMRINNSFPGNIDIQFFVNGKKVFPHKHQDNLPERVRINKMPQEKLERFAKLPKHIPSSKVRRLSGKIVYEIEVPGVDNIENILINKLENSIEIKALARDKVYSKILNINLPLISYKLNNGNLVIELAAR